jgi:hypothetical protein
MPQNRYCSTRKLVLVINEDVRQVLVTTSKKPFIISFCLQVSIYHVILAKTRNKAYRAALLGSIPSSGSSYSIVGMPHPVILITAFLFDSTTT